MRAAFCKKRNFLSILRNTLIDEAHIYVIIKRGGLVQMYQKRKPIRNNGILIHNRRKRT